MKNILSEDWYHMTCRAVQRTSHGAQLVFTVDVGPHKFTNVIETIYYDIPATARRMARLMGQLNTIIPDDPKSLELELAVTGLRGLFKIGHATQSDVHTTLVRNIVLDAKLPQTPPEIDLFATRNDSYILRGSQFAKSKLPLNPQPL